MMTKEGSTKIVNCITPEAGVHIVKMHQSFINLLYSDIDQTN